MQLVTNKPASIGWADLEDQTSEDRLVLNLLPRSEMESQRLKAIFNQVKVLKTRANQWDQIEQWISEPVIMPPRNAPNFRHLSKDLVFSFSWFFSAFIRFPATWPLSPNWHSSIFPVWLAWHLSVPLPRNERKTYGIECCLARLRRC